MEVILNINDLKYKNLFENLSIYIEKDKITTISGANNCGKTTLLRILTRQVKTENIIKHIIITIVITNSSLFIFYSPLNDD